MEVKKNILGIKIGVLLLFLLLNLFVFCTNSFATEGYNTNRNDKFMSLDMATKLLEYGTENFCVTYTGSQSTYETHVSRGQQWISKATPDAFAKYFNNTFFDMIEQHGYEWATGSQNSINWSNITAFFMTPSDLNCGYVYFIISNNAAGSDDLDYINLDFSIRTPTSKYNYFKIMPTNLKAIGYKFTSNVDAFTSELATTARFSDQVTLKLPTLNTDRTLITVPFFYGFSLDTIYYRPYGSDTFLPYILTNVYDGYTNPNPEEPENPDDGEDSGGSGNTGNITNPSGDTTVKVDLSGIEQGIGNINQNIDKTNEKLDGISGELGDLNNNLTTVPDISDKTITSEDITGSFDFEFAEDPYANFWLELTTRTFWCFN